MSSDAERTTAKAAARPFDGMQLTLSRGALGLLAPLLISSWATWTDVRNQSANETLSLKKEITELQLKISLQQERLLQNEKTFALHAQQLFDMEYWMKEISKDFEVQKRVQQQLHGTKK